MGVPMVTAGELMADRTGSVNPSQFPDEEFDLYSIPAFDSGSPEVTTGKEIGSNKQIVQPGDVLLSKIVPHIRRAWIVSPNRGRRIIASSEWIVFRSQRAHPGYLKHLLVGDNFHKGFMATVSGVGGSLLRARPSIVERIQIPLPPLPEQRRIADILDRADALRVKRRSAMAQLDGLAQAIFVEMFGDPVRNPKGWKKSTISKLLSNPLRNGRSPSTQGSLKLKVLTLSAITGGGFSISGLKESCFDVVPPTNCIVGHEDFLICRGNGNKNLVGKGYFPVGKLDIVYFPDTMIAGRFDKDRLSKEYFEFVWNSQMVRNQIETLARTTNGTFKINQQSIEGIEVLVPPLELQNQFSILMSRKKTAKEILLSSTDQLENLFVSLQDRAFRGAI